MIRRRLARLLDPELAESRDDALRAWRAAEGARLALERENEDLRRVLGWLDPDNREGE